MPELISRRQVRARKPHRCDMCQAMAADPGDTYTRETWVYDGHVYDLVSCEPCRAIRTLVHDWSCDDGGVGADTYAEWAEEFKDDPVHGEAAWAYLVRARGVVAAPAKAVA